MLDEEQGVNEEITQPQAEETESPTEEVTQESEDTGEATQQQAEVQPTQEQAVPYDRFKDVIEEKNYYKSLLEKQMASQKPVEQAPQQMGNTPEEREFWNQVGKVSQKQAETLMKAKELQFQQQLEAQQRVIGTLLSRDFRRNHSDVKPDSPEEYKISQKIQMGYDPDDAYKVVMFEKQGQTANQRAQQSVKQKLQVKKKANVETNSVQQGGLPHPKESFRETLERHGNEDGAWDDLS